MKRSVQEIVELLVFGLIALLLGTGLLWLMGWVFGLVGGVFRFFAGLIWDLLRFVVPVAIFGALVYLIVRLLQQQRTQGRKPEDETKGTAPASPPPAPAPGAPPAETAGSDTPTTGAATVDPDPTGTTEAGTPGRGVEDAPRAEAPPPPTVPPTTPPEARPEESGGFTTNDRTDVDTLTEDSGSWQFADEESTESAAEGADRDPWRNPYPQRSDTEEGAARDPWRNPYPEQPNAEEDDDRNRF